MGDITKQLDELKKYMKKQFDEIAAHTKLQTQKQSSLSNDITDIKNDLAAHNIAISRLEKSSSSKPAADTTGKPMLDENGQPILDADGNPIFDTDKSATSKPPKPPADFTKKPTEKPHRGHGGGGGGGGGDDSDDDDDDRVGGGRGGGRHRNHRDNNDDDRRDRRLPPRLHRIRFPSYDGLDDPLQWLNKCEQFFRGQNTPEEDKVWYASFYLDGVAQQWYYRLERDHGEPSWPEFVQHVNMRFGPPLRTNSLGELAQLRRTGSVEDYQRQFLALLCRCDKMTDKQSTQLFTAGLL